MKKKVAVVTWDNRLVMLPKGKTLLQQLVGQYYIARIGYTSLLNLGYCIFFDRLSGYRGLKEKGISRITYNLVKNLYAANEIKSKIPSMKRGILNVLTRRMSLRVMLRQIPRESAINLPLHRYHYQFVAACLIGPNGEILDIDCKSDRVLYSNQV